MVRVLSSTLLSFHVYWNNKGDFSNLIIFPRKEQVFCKNEYFKILATFEAYQLEQLFKVELFVFSTVLIEKFYCDVDQRLRKKRFSSYVNTFLRR